MTPDDLMVTVWRVCGNKSTERDIHLANTIAQLEAKEWEQVCNQHLRQVKKLKLQIKQLKADNHRLTEQLSCHVPGVSNEN